LLQVIRGATLAVTAFTAAAVAAPAVSLAARQPALASAQPQVEQAGLAAARAQVADSEQLDLNWETNLTAAGRQLHAEQERRQTRTAIARPSPQKAPASPVSATAFEPGSVQQIIASAFAPYGAPAVQWGLHVAACESGFDPHAYNASGHYYGLFQFSMSTFLANAQRAAYGYSSNDIWDPAASARVAAYMYSKGQQGQWGCSS
jgi:Transglycosylase SLT domain